MMNKREIKNSKINTPETDIVIKLSGISKKYNLYQNKQDRLKEALDPRRKKYHRDFYALKDINLEVKRGEVLGIVGKNGSGKSTLLTIIAGILTPTAGAVETKGSIVPLLELGAGFNPEFTGMENIYFYCSLLGFNRQQTDNIVDEIIAFAELDDFIHQPIKTYSSGMKARLNFAVSVNVDPEILILDEVLSVGDELFKRKCYARMEEFFKGGKTILFVSHSAPSINELCTRAVMLDRGELILDGPAPFVTRYYNQLLYTLPDRQNEVRKALIRLNLNQQDKDIYIERMASEIAKPDPYEAALPTPEIIEDKSKPVAYFIPNFISKTTVKHESFEAEIFDSQIQTLSGKRVNVLVMNEEYTLSYKARFNRVVENVRFATLIQSIKGLAISGFLLDMESSRKIMANETYLVKNRFKCTLLPGTYYVNIAVTKINENNEKVRLYAINDATVFKVLEVKKKSHWGIVNLGQTGQIQKVD